MGPQTRIAGTPPFVPPEAVYFQPLDARCDLYALGALAYFLLTKRNAYPAREIAELRERWQHRPQPPEALRPDVPRALSDLVMALLSLDARGRPGSAAEVVERLSGIASLPEEDERRYAQAFLTSPKLVGRDRESGALRKRLLRALRGRGGAAAIVAPGGFGRSRMLASFVLEAKLLGAAAVHGRRDRGRLRSLRCCRCARRARARGAADELGAGGRSGADLVPCVAGASPRVRRRRRSRSSRRSSARARSARRCSRSSRSRAASSGSCSRSTTCTAPTANRSGCSLDWRCGPASVTCCLSPLAIRRRLHTHRPRSNSWCSP